MSFSRWTADCDVYAFEHCDGYFACCGCSLPGKAEFDNRTELVEHMREHQRAGHKVPEYVIANILRDDNE